MSKKRLEFVFPQKVFALSTNAKGAIHRVGRENSKVLIIDGFYKNPELVRDFFLKSPVPIWKTQPGSRNFKDYFDCRHVVDFTYGFEHVTDYLSQIIKQEFGYKVSFPKQGVSNVFQLIKGQPKDTTAFPHIDASPVKSNDQPVNALIYLNTDKEARGGTA